MSSTCEIFEQAAQPTLTIRAHAAVQNLPQLMGQSFGAIAGYLGELGEAPAGAPFAAYYNMDMQDLDVEMGIPVSSKLPGRGEIQSTEIPAGKYVTSLHTGPYDQCGPVYEAMNRWIAEHNYEVTGVAYEFYLNDPGEVSPDQLKMQIIFPLKNG
jgi:effector-binding domain-containing protein